MFPGLVSKMSEAPIALNTTIYPVTDLIRVNDTATTTVVATIVPPYAGFGGFLVIANRSGNNITTVTTGNILTAKTIGVDVAIVLVYSQAEAKWIPGALA